MANELTVTSSVSEGSLATYEQFLQIVVGGQLFGIPVFRVRDVLKPHKITKIPLASPEILGFMNLRGRIVTVIDMRKRLSVEREKDTLKKMFVVVESDNELYALQIDEVRDTKTVPVSGFEKNPENMTPSWKDVSRGVFKLEKELMLVLDVSNLIKI